MLEAQALKSLSEPQHGTTWATGLSLFRLQLYSQV